MKTPTFKWAFLFIFVTNNFKEIIFMNIRELKKSPFFSFSKLLVVLLLIGVSSCQQQKRAPKYYDLKETYFSKKLNTFDKVKVDCGINVYYLQQEGPCLARIVCGTVYYDYLILDVQDSILHIDMKKLPEDLKRESDDMNVYISSPYLKEIKLNKGCDFKFQNYYKSSHKLSIVALNSSELKSKLSVDLENIEMLCKNNSEIDFDDIIVSKTVNAKSGLNSEIELNGRCNDAFFEAWANAEIDADLFMANNVTTKAASEAKITCNVNGVLTASNTEDASTTYGGRTKKVKNLTKTFAKRY